MTDCIHLMYHRVEAASTTYPYSVSPECFAQHLQLVTSLNADSEGRFFRPQFTFDDGHRSNHDPVLSILDQYGATATFFVTAAWIGRRKDSMDWQQVAALHRAGHVIGSHGYTHKMLTSCSDTELESELRGSKDALEQALGTVIDSISVPGGRWNRQVLRACHKAGYRKVFTSDPGVGCTLREEISVVPRFNVTAAVDVETLREVLTPGSHVLRLARVKHRALASVRHFLGDRLYHSLWCTLFAWTSDEEQ